MDKSYQLEFALATAYLGLIPTSSNLVPGMMAPLAPSFSWWLGGVGGNTCHDSKGLRALVSVQ